MFRKEAIEAQKQKLTGDILLTQPLSIFTVTIAIVSFILVAGLFLFTSKYARKETVKGYLVPDQGVVRVYASRNGTIKTLHVSDSDVVAIGDPLVTLIMPRAMASGQELSESLIEELRHQVGLIELEMGEIRNMYEKDIGWAGTRKRNSMAALSIMGKERRLLAEKLALKNHEIAQHQRLFAKGHLSATALEEKQRQLLEVKQELESAKSKEVEIQSQIDEATHSIESLPHKLALSLTEASQRKSDILRQLSEIESQYLFVIKAQEAGTVTAISAVQGEYVDGNKSLLSVLPTGSKMVAELLLPTRSAGFIRVGDPVKLRFDAFPYQRFSFISGAVARIDKALILRGENILPIPLEESVYKIRADLSQQAIRAYGSQYALKSGMLLEADIILEKRSLIQWLFDPLYSLKGRIN